mmetsp:Transcript_5613/g.18237  ORF Transcript_5613/g.18237 Transcript_5613/m.18237 type:complete len:239 (-) Transcript_5613:172-888(-)
MALPWPAWCLPLAPLTRPPVAGPFPPSSRTLRARSPSPSTLPMTPTSLHPFVPLPKLNRSPGRRARLVPPSLPTIRRSTPSLSCARRHPFPLPTSALTPSTPLRTSPTTSTTCHPFLTSSAVPSALTRPPLLPRLPPRLPRPSLPRSPSTTASSCAPAPASSPTTDPRPLPTLRSTLSLRLPPATPALPSGPQQPRKSCSVALHVLAVGSLKSWQRRAPPSLRSSSLCPLPSTRRRLS